MKKIFYIGIISMLFLSTIGCNNQNVANVNGVNITKDQYEKTMNIINNTKKYNGINLEDEEKKNILYFMIDNEVLYQKAREGGFLPNDEDVKLKYDEIIGALDANIKYKEIISEIGLNKEYLIEVIKKDMAINNYKQNFEKNIKIDDKDVKKFYQENKSKFQVEEINVSHILISKLDKNNNMVTKKEDDVLREKANDILIKIQSGEAFEELAKEHSDDKSSGKNGGELGYFTKRDKNIEFTKEVFKLNKGEISNVIETSSGYHIVRVNDKVNKLSSIKKCKDDINKEILKEAYTNHIEELNKSSNIRIY